MDSTRKIPGSGNNHRQQLSLERKSGEGPLISKYSRMEQEFQSNPPSPGNLNKLDLNMHTNMLSVITVLGSEARKGI